MLGTKDIGGWQRSTVRRIPLRANSWNRRRNIVVWVHVEENECRQGKIGYNKDFRLGARKAHNLLNPRRYKRELSVKEDDNSEYINLDDIRESYVYR